MTALEQLEHFLDCCHAGELTFTFGTQLACNGELRLALEEDDRWGAVTQYYAFHVGGCENIEEAASKLWEDLQRWLVYNKPPAINLGERQ